MSSPDRPPPLPAFARKALTLGRFYLAYMLQYRAEIALWVLASVLPLILLGVWAEAARSAELPLARVEFIRYFLAVFVARQFSFVWVIWEFEELVVSGSLSAQLLQPLHPVWRLLAGHITERLVRLPLVAAVVALGLALYPEAWWTPRPAQLLAAAALMGCAFLVRFWLQFAMSMLAFWSERASALEELWFVAYLFLSGLVAPLDLYPAGLRVVTELTPFPYLIYYPARLAMGQTLPLTQPLLVLGAWGLAAFGVQRWLWKRGLQRYSAMGA